MLMHQRLKPFIVVALQQMNQFMYDDKFQAFWRLFDDYNMVDGKRVISVRSALIPYAVQALNLDLNKIEAKPEAQQITVANLDEVKQHAF